MATVVAYVPSALFDLAIATLNSWFIISSNAYDCSDRVCLSLLCDVKCSV